jgi:hypothetical protein
VRPRQGKHPRNPYRTDIYDPSPKSAILRILGVDRHTFPYSFDGRRIVPAELWDPGLKFIGPVPKPVVSAAPFSFGRNISFLLPDIGFLLLVF